MKTIEEIYSALVEELKNKLDRKIIYWDELEDLFKIIKSIWSYKYQYSINNMEEYE